MNQICFFVSSRNFISRSQKDLSNRMLCWCQRAACSITSTMRHVAGHSSDGTKPALQRARNVICKCAVSLCCYPAEFHCSPASSLSAVQSTLKVREILGVFRVMIIITPGWLSLCGGTRMNMSSFRHEKSLNGGRSLSCHELILIYFIQTISNRRF